MLLCDATLPDYLESVRRYPRRNPIHWGYLWVVTIWGLWGQILAHPRGSAAAAGNCLGELYCSLSITPPASQLFEIPLGGQKFFTHIHVVQRGVVLGVASVLAFWDQLVVPYFLNAGLLVIFGGFIVQHLLLGVEACCFKAIN